MNEAIGLYEGSTATGQTYKPSSTHVMSQCVHGPHACTEEGTGVVEVLTLAE